MRKILSFLMIFALSGCLGMPDGLRPVDNFELNRYLGTWYEIARLDHSFERGLSHVTAHYELQDDGSVSVTNRGFSITQNEWREAKGKAKFVNDPDEAYLKVSFFGPFYGSYVVFELDQENYQYAFVSGPNTSYLWLLSRTPTISQSIKDKFLNRASELGFETDKLIFVEQGN